MKIKQLQFKNIGSYGNSITTIDFDKVNSLNMMVGKNGAGKSTVLNAIEFAIYGSVVGKTLSTLPNRFNNGELWTEINILLDNGKEMVITRGLKPKLFRVVIGGVDLSDIAGVSNVNKLIQTHIKIPQSIFQNLIVLNVSHYKSFLKMSNKEKGILIDKLFGLDVLNSILLKNQKDTKEIKSKLDSITASLSVYQNEIASTEIQLNELRKPIEPKVESNREDEIKGIVENIYRFSELLETGQSKSKDLKEKIQSIWMEVSAEKANRDSLLKREKGMESADGKCPICGSETKHFHNLKDEVKKGILATNQIISEKELVIKELETKWSEFQGKIRVLESKIRNLSNEKLEIENEIKKEKSEKEIATGLLDQRIEKLNEQVESLNIERIEFQDKFNVHALVEESVGDSGFKSYILNSIVPSINNQLSIFGDILGIPFVCEFDSKFNLVVSYQNESIDITTLSTGEYKKVELSVLFSLISVLKLRYCSVNILFLDELMDGLDVDNVNHIFEILQKIKDKKDLNIFVVHHGLLDSNYFDRVLQFKKMNGFSQIEELKF